MADYLALADALALRYVGLDPPDQPAVKGSTARLPNNPPSFPYIGVTLEEGDLTYLAGRLDTEVRAIVRLYHGSASGDLPRITAALYSYLTLMLTATHGAVKLGMPSLVQKAIPVGFRVGVFEWAGVEYIGVEVRVGLWLEEAVTLTP